MKFFLVWPAPLSELLATGVSTRLSPPELDRAVRLHAEKCTAVLSATLDGGVGKDDLANVHVEPAGAAVREFECGVGNGDRVGRTSDGDTRSRAGVRRDVRVYDGGGTLDGHARRTIIRRVDRQVGILHVQLIHIEGLTEALDCKRCVLEIEIARIEPGTCLGIYVDRSVFERHAGRVEVRFAFVVGRDGELILARRTLDGTDEVETVRAARARIVPENVIAVGDGGAGLAGKSRLEAGHRERAFAREGGAALKHDAVDAVVAAGDSRTVRCDAKRHTGGNIDRRGKGEVVLDVDLVMDGSAA